MTQLLDPQARAILEVMRAMDSVPVHTLSVFDARERMRASLIAKGDPVPTWRVEDLESPGLGRRLPLRLYRPAEGELGAALFLHGGGWTLNDLDTHDELCRQLAGASGLLIAALDYRLAPEHKYPAALEDVYCAYRWLIDNAQSLEIDVTSGLIVVGESSGATLAAGLSLFLRDSGAPVPGLQALAYPMTDRPGRWPSHAERGHGYTLDRPLIDWFLEHYLPRGYDPADPYLFPLAAGDLSGLPPTLVMTAEFDPLRDEGAAYATRLADAGVPVRHHHVGDQMHGFLLHGRAVKGARQLVDVLADALRDRPGE
jgi:acetyl esterase